jgi:hypothetical protein
MSKNSIGTAARNSANIFWQLEQISFNSIRKMLPDKAIVDICRQLGYVYRCRILSPIVTILHMIIAAIWPEESFNASWHLLWTKLVSHHPEHAGKSPTRASVAKARARLPLELWRRLFAWLSGKAQALADSLARWKGHRVVLLDGTCLSMPDTPGLLEAFGTNTGYKGKGKYPLARMVTLCLANTMTVLDYALGRYTDGETTLAFKLLDNLKKGDLLVADRHFAAAHYYVRYLSMGLEFLTRVHQRVKICRLEHIYSYSKDDFVGWLQVNPVYRRKDPSLPERVMVRFIQTSFRIRGRHTVVWLATSLLDGQKYPPSEVASLYASRWRIETLFRQTKVNMSADVLRSLTADGIRKEIAARLMAINIVRMIMLEAATENEVDPLRISFVFAVRAIINFAPAFAVESPWVLPSLYRAMLTEVAAHRVPERPGRNEPRAVRREYKHYPSLKVTRRQWRSNNAA